MFHSILFTLSVLGLFIATLTDLKERIIPNKLTFSLIGGGLFLHLVYAFAQADVTPFAFSAVATALAFGFAYLLWKIGLWAGGDVKIFTALAALNPVNYFVLGPFLNLSGAVFQPLQLPFFFFSLFVFTIFAMFPYALLISLAGILRRQALRAKIFHSLFGGLPLQAFKVFEFVVLALGVGAILDFVGWPLWVPLMLGALDFWMPLYFLASIVLIWGLLALPKIPQYLAVALLFLFAFFTQMTFIEVLISNFISLLALFFALKALLHLMAANKEVMRRQVKVSELKEGEIPAETWALKDGKASPFEGVGFKTIFQAVKERNIALIERAKKPEGKILASSLSAAGFTAEQAKEFKALSAKGKAPKEITIKLSAPLAPAILIAFVVLHIIGDWLWHFIL